MSINMAVDNKKKPLKMGRQMFSWFCLDVIDEPLNKNRMLSRQIFRILFIGIFIILAVAANSPLLTNHMSVNDINEIFFEIFQFDLTSYTASAIIATFVWGSKLASIFRNLEHIYNACKGLLLSHRYFY